MQYSTYCTYCDFSLQHIKERIVLRITQEELNFAFLAKQLEKKND